MKERSLGRRDFLERSAVAAVLLLALGLRLYRLHEANVWVDEEWTGWVIRESVSTILEPDLDPPIPRLHYVLLHYWWLLAGDTEFALRFSSVLFGVASVALIYALGRRLLGTTTGMAAALLLTVSGLHIGWASQMIRMYSLIGLLSLASIYCFSRVWEIGIGCDDRAPRSKLATLADWGAYFGTTLAMMHTHFLGAGILLGENAFVLVLAAWSWSRLSKSELAGWLALQVALACLFLPQLWYGLLSGAIK